MAVALNDLFYYICVNFICVNFGLQREGMGCLRQDIQATALLVGGLLVLGLGRVMLGVKFSAWDRLMAAAQ